jgi:CheY-like chemotaxis protein
MRPRRILICDDEAALRQLLRVVIDGDYEFSEVADGSEIVASASQLEPDLIVLDLMMPGAGGLAVLEQLRSDPVLHAVPVVVLTAWPDHERAALEAGADRFLAKPFEPDALKSVVDELLGLA